MKQKFKSKNNNLHLKGNMKFAVHFLNSFLLD